MELTIKILKTRYLKAIICLFLCLATLSLTFDMDTQEVYAFLPALVLGGFAVSETVQIVGALLCAAGLTWAADTAIDSTCQWYYANCAPVIKQGLTDMIYGASNGIATVSTQVWEYTRSWVQSNFTTGANTKSINYHEFPMDNYSMPFTADAQITTPIASFTSLVWQGHVYSVVETMGTTYRTLNIAIDGNIRDTSNNLYAPSKTVHKTNPYYLYLNTNADGSTGLYIALRYTPSGSDIYQDSAYWKMLPDTLTLTDSLVGTATKAIAVTGQEVLSNPTWDIETPEGKRQIGYPDTLTDLVGKVSADVSTPANTGSTTGDTITSGWLQGALDSLGQLLVGTLAQIKAAIEGIASPIVDAITGAVTTVGAKIQELTNTMTGVAENTAEADMTGKMRQYKIPDLFILILKVILACIRLILRALVFIATLPLIAADAGDINSNFLAGVNFLRNQTIPHFGVSIWEMSTGVVSIFFGLAVVKRIRRLYSV